MKLWRGLLQAVRDARTPSPTRWRARWQDRWFTGHVYWWRITIYGANAMHWAINISTPWGYLCAHPTTRTFGGHWPWYVYLSRDGTPQGARWIVGEGGTE